MDCYWWGRIHLSAIRQCKQCDCFSQSCVCLIDGNADTNICFSSYAEHRILSPHILRVSNAFAPQLAAMRMLRHCLRRIYRFDILTDHCTNGRKKEIIKKSIFGNYKKTSDGSTHFKKKSFKFSSS